jgi:trans-aconitate 2-methyltransferase
MTQWNPEAYLKFQDERTQPSYDLAARVDLSGPARIVDIGCGPGNSTRVLRERWPQARITGLDSSPQMIAKAEAAYPEETWVLADAATWETDERFDLVFSNAALQWIPGHEALVRKLFAPLNPGGALAVQVPANNDSPIYLAVNEVAQRAKWRDAMRGCGELLTYHDPGFYYDLLSALSPRVSLWQTTYFHVLASHQSLIDWYSSTGLRPYLERLLGAEQKRAFQEQVLDTCRAGYPPQRDGRILFPFKRLFFVAYRG